MKIVDSECNKRSHKVKGSRMVKEKKKLRCRKYFRTFVDKGKDMKTVFENFKNKRIKRRCKGRRCRKPKSKSKIKTKPKSKQKPRFRSTKNVNSALMNNPFHNQQKPRLQGIALIQLISKIGVIVVCFQLIAHSL